MCGIAGFFSRWAVLNREVLVAMTDSLSHRGPDASGYFLDDQVGLGHRRLSILDLSKAANQPMVSHCGRYYIIYNGEVYNFRELAREIPYPMRTTGDTETLVEAFACMGPDFVQKLNGMFAIAIYDREEKKLFLFRDRLGIKPLFYSFYGENFLFGSELKAVLQAVNRDELRPNVQALNQFLHLGYIPEPHTAFKEIEKFPAGHWAVVQSGNLTIKPYWTPEEQVEQEIISDFTQAKRQLKALVESSVRYRLVSDVPFGTFLSGGTDSSVVTAVAASVHNAPLNTFSIGFKEARYNEAQHAAAVAKHLGCNHHEFIVSTEDALELFDRIQTGWDEPFGDSSAFPTMLVSRLARKHVTMTLSGDGGDELFLGYGAYNWAKRMAHPLLPLLRKPLAAALSLGGNREKRAAWMFRYANRKRMKSHIFSQEQYCFSENELRELMAPGFFKNPELRIENPKLSRKLEADEAQALFDIRYYLKDDLLVKVDRASMQFSLEARVPLLDHRIVHFALNLDRNLKIHQGTTKFLLKELLYDYVPRQLFDRPKWGFAIPLQEWLLRELAWLPDTFLSKAVVERQGMVRYEEALNILNRFRGGEHYLYNRVWLLVVLHQFLERWFPDGNHHHKLTPLSS